MQKEVASKNLFYCLFIVYIVNVFGKIAFSAVTVELVEKSILTKTEAGLVSGMFWLIYAIGQIFGGSLASKMSPYLMLKLTFIGSVAANLLMSFSESFVPMLVIWTLNGFIQFGMYPAILRMVTTEVVPSQRGRALTMLSYCYCLGSILSYFLTAVILLVFPWQYMFMFCALANLLSFIYIVVIQKKCSAVLSEDADDHKLPEHAKTGKLTLKLTLESGLIFFSAIIFIRSIHESSVKNWMPTILNETYGASASFTLFLSVVLLVVNLFGVTVAFFIHRRVRRNDAVTVLILYGITLPLMVILTGFRSYDVYTSTIIMTICTMLFYGTGQVVALMYVSRFQNYGLTAMAGGIINCFAAFGNVVASYGGGFIADNFGWDTLIHVWVALVVLCMVLALIVMRVYRGFKAKTTMRENSQNT